MGGTYGNLLTSPPSLCTRYVPYQGRFDLSYGSGKCMGGAAPPRDPTPLDDLASRGSANVGFTASWHQDKNRTKVMVKIYWLTFMIIGSSGTSL